MEPYICGSLRASDVTDTDAAFVADPFVLRRGDTWYLFVEVWDRGLGRGVIGVAESRSGLDWSWIGVVLEEPFHLSYPQVFTVDDHVYMVPETGAAGAVRLYEATEFPISWAYRGDLITGGQPTDASLLLHGGRWWCFVEANQPHNDTLRLFSAVDLNPGTEWSEHPMSPIVTYDDVTARPGGPPLQIGDQWYRLSQSCSPRYGVAVRAHRIDDLTEQNYREDRRGFVLVHPSGRGWNRLGSHHVSVTSGPTDGEILVAFDGY